MAGVKDFDRHTTSLVKSLPPSISPLMDVCSAIGEPVVILSVAAAGLTSSLVRGKSDEQDAIVLASIGFSIATLMKLVLKRNRPHGRIVRNFGISSYSFPSGHAYGSVIFYGLFAIINTRYLASPWDIILSLLAAVLILLIGISRVYKGVHYPSDVVAGWLLGCGILILVNSIAF